MKFILFVIVASIMITGYSFPQAPDITWTRTYGGNGVELDFGESVQQTTDRGFIICGWTGSFGLTSSAVWLIKTDAMGDTLWSKIFDTDGDDRGFSVKQTNDGGFILSGRKDTFGSTAGDVWLIKTNEFGDIIWSKTFGGNGFESGYSVKQTFDEGFIVSGEQDFGSWLLKTDSFGDTLWTKNYLGILTSGLDVAQTSDSGYIITGYLTDILGENLRLLKTDSEGDTLWAKTYIRGRGESVQQTNDKGYIITGYNSMWGDLCLIKADLNGNTEWIKRYGGIDDAHGFSVQQTLDNDYIITGYNSLSAGDHNLWVLKTNSLGDTLWTKSIDDSGSEEGYSIQQTLDGGYIITGINGGFYQWDLWLIKLNADTVTKVSRETPPIKFMTLQNYPNPFNPSTKISWQVPAGSWQTLKIYDVLGNEVTTLVDEYKPAGSYEVEWDASNYPSGVYFYQLKTEKYTESKKMILMK